MRSYFVHAPLNKTSYEQNPRTLLLFSLRMTNHKITIWVQQSSNISRFENLKRVFLETCTVSLVHPYSASGHVFLQIACGGVLIHSHLQREQTHRARRALMWIRVGENSRSNLNKNVEIEEKKFSKCTYGCMKCSVAIRTDGTRTPWCRSGVNGNIVESESRRRYLRICRYFLRTRTAMGLGSSPFSMCCACNTTGT